jgi:hypothetical protein
LFQGQHHRRADRRHGEQQKADRGDGERDLAAPATAEQQKEAREQAQQQKIAGLQRRPNQLAEDECQTVLPREKPLPSKRRRAYDIGLRGISERVAA